MQTGMNKKNNYQLGLASLPLCGFVLLILFYPVESYSGNALEKFSELKEAGLLLVNNQGQSVVSTHAKKSFIPASATKLVTAWLALNHWGEGYHFRTHFYLDTSTKTLWVKGSGDPFLVSEELDLISKNLKQLGIRKINSIGLDVSFFQPNLITPGAGYSNNPYDAISTAIAGNFNTVAIKKVAGKIYSDEPQTPLTPFAKSASKRIKVRALRINTGRYSHDSERYFAELLAAFLRKHDVIVGDQIIWGNIPHQQTYYSHVNSKSLGEIIRPMMKYSTNFIANQLVLMLSAEKHHRPANFIDVQRYMEETLIHQFNWKEITLKEGAGLSRENRLSPEQLVQLLQAFRPWKHLLPEVQSGVYAKSGTLNKVSTLAGYIVDSNQQWKAFALMMNQAVPNHLRNLIVHELTNR